ncbi:hypothetical protein MCEMIE22_02559 [Mycobacteriaceae bacterium]
MFGVIAIGFCVLGLLAVLAALLVGGIITGIVAVVYATDRESSTPAESAAIAGLGIAAFIATLTLGPVAPGAAWMPVVVWLVAVYVIRQRAELMETPQQRKVREAAERAQAEQDEKRAAARKAIAERKRVDSFTKDGLALMAKARTAVSAVRATEAARDGWLGDQADLDFSADLTLISDALLQARRIEKMVERSKKIPDPSPEDVAMLRDAEKTMKTLRTDAKGRVGIIEDCVKQAREIDRLLAEERRQQEFDRQRDAARRQLAAELYVAEVRSPARHSDTADAIAARVQAFRELKKVVDEKVLREVEAGGAKPANDLFTQVRRLLSL